MLGPEIEFPALIAGCNILGFTAHYLKKAAEAKTEIGGWRGLFVYILGNPASTLAMITANAGLTLGFWSIGQLNGLTAFCIGYIGNSAADVVGNRVIGLTKIEPKEKPP